MLKEKERIFEDLKQNPLRFGNKINMVKTLKNFSSLKTSIKNFSSLEGLDSNNNENKKEFELSIIPEKISSVKNFSLNSKSILKQKKKKVVDNEKLKEFEEKLNNWFLKTKKDLHKIYNIKEKADQKNSLPYILQTGGKK